MDSFVKMGLKWAHLPAFFKLGLSFLHLTGPKPMKVVALGPFLVSLCLNIFSKNHLFALFFLIFIFI